MGFLFKLFYISMARRGVGGCQLRVGVMATPQPPAAPPTTRPPVARVSSWRHQGTCCQTGLTRLQSIHLTRTLFTDSSTEFSAMEMESGFHESNSQRLPNPRKSIWHKQVMAKCPQYERHLVANQPPLANILQLTRLIAPRWSIPSVWSYQSILLESIDCLHVLPCVQCTRFTLNRATRLSVHCDFIDSCNIQQIVPLLLAFFCCGFFFSIFSSTAHSWGADVKIRFIFWDSLIGRLMPVRGNGAEMKLCNQNHKMAADDTVDVSSSFARQPHSTHIIIIDNIYTYKYLIFFF